MQKWVQQRLNAHGAHLAVDGDFGTHSAQALGDFQSRNGLNADTVAGAETLRKLAS